MSTRSLALGLAAVSLSAAVAAAAQTPPLVIRSMAGRDLYEFYCAPCHGRDLRGEGPAATALKTRPADLTAITTRHAGRFPKAEIAAFVLNGTPLVAAHGSTEMPVWGPIFRALDPSDVRARVRIDNLVAYIESMQSVRSAAGAQAPDVRTGGALFATYCASCHGRDGHGDGQVAEHFRIRPTNLTEFAKMNGGLFPEEKTRRIIDGRDKGVRAHGNTEMPVWGDAFRRREGLSEEAAKARIEAIVRYLGSIQERSGH